MNVLAALGDAPTAAIAVVAIVLGIFVVVRGRRGERAGDEKPAPSLLAVPATGSGAGGADDGLQKMAVHDIGHGTIRLGGKALSDTEPTAAVAALAPQLPPTVAPEPEPVSEAPSPEPEPAAALPEPEPEAVQPTPEAAQPAPEAAQPEPEPEPEPEEPEATEQEPEPAPPQPEPQPPAWMALRSPPPAAVPQTWGGSQAPPSAQEPEPESAPAPLSPAQPPAPQPSSGRGPFRQGRIRLRRKPPGE
jgi:hypothetical protein